MCKISILFKPSIKSWIMSDLQYLEYYEIKNYKDIDKVKNKKVLIHTNYDELWEVYEKLKNSDKKIIVLVCSITDLFE